MSKEAIKSLLEAEGFSHIFEWPDEPTTEYNTHSHKDKVAVITTAGTITFNIAGENKIFKTGERFDVPIGVPHSAIVGSDGWACIVGEMIEGDS